MKWRLFEDGQIKTVFFHDVICIAITSTCTQIGHMIRLLPIRVNPQDV